MDMIDLLYRESSGGILMSLVMVIEDRSGTIKM